MPTHFQWGGHKNEDIKEISVTLTTSIGFEAIAPARPAMKLDLKHTIETCNTKFTVKYGTLYASTQFPCKSH
jgi:hypothetical protein